MHVHTHKWCIHKSAHTQHLNVHISGFFVIRTLPLNKPNQQVRGGGVGRGRGGNV